MTTISKNVNQGDSVSIQATPNTGYIFSGWTESGDPSRVITDNPYTFTPNSDVSLDALFSEATPIISWVGNPGNIVIKNSNGQTHNLWSGAGTNKYYGNVEGFGANDIVSVYVNNPNSTNTITPNTWLTSLDLSGLTNLTIERRSFAYCTSLTTLVLPNSSYSINDAPVVDNKQTSGAFQGCTSLSSLSLGSCTSIGSHAFQGCTSLGTVNLPSTCTSIGNNAFTSCSVLRTLNFASGGTALSIGVYAFYGCDIRALELPSYLTEIAESSWGICYDVGISLDRPYKNNGCNPFQANNNLASITMPTASTRYRAEGNCLIDTQYLPNAKSGDTSNYNAVIVGCKNSIIPTTRVDAIGAAAFMNNTGITSITIPERIRYIEAYAFYGCTNLATITFTPDSGIIMNPYLRICGNAFGYCDSVSSITFPSRMKQFGASYYNSGSVFYGTSIFANSASETISVIHLDSVATPPVIVGGSSGDSYLAFPDSVQKIYIKPGTMASYQNDTMWAYWYNQKKLYSGVNISSSVDPAGSSTVSKSSNSVEIRSDSLAPTVRLEATANTGYTFNSWKRGSTVLSTSNPYTATVVDDGTGNDEFIAYSIPASYTISASVNPNGGGTVSGAGTYNHGTSCTVSATENTGYNFVNWTEGGNTVSSSSSYTFTVSGARTLVANFELERYTISASPNTVGWGTITGTGSYSYGDSVSLVANPTTGYELACWTENGNIVSSSSTYTFTATQDRTLVAVFASSSAIEINTTGSDTVYLKNNSNQTYTWNLSSGNNRYTGSVSGFELNNLKSIYRFSTASSSSDSVITSVDISESSISVIPSYAFYNCTALNTLVLSDTLETINNYAFCGCTALTSFTIPSSVKYINRTSFIQSGWWSNQSGTILYKDNICFGYKTTNPTGVVSITSGTRVIAGDAFGLCSGITSISLPNSLKVINSLAFNYCSGLHSLTIPSSVEYIGLDTVGNSGIYSDAAEHTFLVLSDCVVGYKGSQTGRITLPSTTRLISSQAFAFQTGITEFVINRATPPIYCPYALDTANNPGDGSCTSPIYVPSANVNTYKAADGWTAVASRIQGFTNNTISASVSPSGSGTISGTGDYMAGDSCTLSCSPSTGYDFVNWTSSGSSISTSNPYTFTVSGNRTLVANLSLQTFTISASPNTSGYGTVSGGGSYSYGDSVSLVATAASGYKFVRWTENGTSVSTNSTYTFTATQDRTLVANFSLLSYSISTSVNPSGSGTVSGGGSKNSGTTCTLTATANSGYNFLNWTESGTIVSSSNPYSFTVNSARTLVANFDQVYSVNVKSISASSSYNVSMGTCYVKLNDTTIAQVEFNGTSPYLYKAGTWPKTFYSTDVLKLDCTNAYWSSAPNIKIRLRFQIPSTVLIEATERTVYTYNLSNIITSSMDGSNRNLTIYLA